LQNVNQPADMIFVRMGCHHHVDIVNVLLAQIGSDGGPGRGLTSVDQDVKVAVIMQ
jgi:hypothetical protein